MRAFLLIMLSFIILYDANSQKHVTLTYKGKKKKFIRAVEKANKVLNDPTFYAEIRKIKSFDNTSLTGEQIANLLERAHQVVIITGAFKPIANASTTTSDEIKLSIFHFSKDLPSAVNTLIHETVHAVDFLDGDGDDFTHASNDNSDGSQDNTAPWVIGAIAEKIVELEQG